MQFANYFVFFLLLFLNSFSTISHSNLLSPNLLFSQQHLYYNIFYKQKNNTKFTVHIELPNTNLSNSYPNKSLLKNLITFAEETECKGDNRPVGAFIGYALVGDWKSAAWEFKKALTTAAGAIGPIGPLLQAAGGLIDDIDPYKNCLAEINKNMGQNFHDIKKLNEKSTEEIIKTINVMGKEFFFNNGYGDYVTSVRDLLRYYESNIQNAFKTGLGRTYYNDIKKTCVNRDERILFLISKFESTLYARCYGMSLMFNKEKQKSRRINRLTNISNISLHQNQINPSNKKNYEYNSCLVSKLLAIFRTDTFQKTKFFTEILIDSLRMIDIAKVCAIFAADPPTLEIQKNLFEDFRKRINLTVEMVKHRLFSWEMASLNNVVHNVTNSFPDIYNNLSPKAKKTFWIDDSSAAKNIINYHATMFKYSFVLFENVTAYKVYCPEISCRFIENFCGLHIAIHSQMGKQDISLIEKAQNRIMNDETRKNVNDYILSTNNCSHIYKYYDAVFPYNRNSNFFSAYFIMCEEKISFGTRIYDMSPYVNTFRPLSYRNNHVGIYDIFFIS